MVHGTDMTGIVWNKRTVGSDWLKYFSRAFLRTMYRITTPTINGRFNHPWDHQARRCVARQKRLINQKGKQWIVSYCCHGSRASCKLAKNDRHAAASQLVQRWAGYPTQPVYTPSQWRTTLRKSRLGHLKVKHWWHLSSYKFICRQSWTAVSTGFGSYQHALDWIWTHGVAELRRLPHIHV